MSFDELNSLLREELAEDRNGAQTPPSVMVVDDDPSVREALDFVLQDKYKVRLCASGLEAVNAVDADTRVVVLDIKMPGLDGFAVYKKIKEKFPHLPIIFHSAYHDLKDPYVIMNEYQPYGYITKGQDHDSQQLLGMIQRAIDHYVEMEKMESFISRLKDVKTRQTEANLMAEELRLMVETLENQVQERTHELRLSEAAANKRANELEAVAFVSAATSALLDTTELLQRVVNLTKNSFNLYHVHIYLLNEEGDTLVLVAGAGEMGQQMVDNEWSIPLQAEQSLVARAARLRQGNIVNDVRLDPHWLPNPLLPDTCSELAVPLIIGDQVLGVLDVQSDKVDYFSEEDIKVQSMLAAQVAVALQNARLFEQVSQANAEIQNLNNQLKTENLRMTAELDVARRLQQMLLPTPEELRQIEGIDIAGFMDPTEEVGGDYYDVLQHNGQVKIGIGDVTGHGLESGVVMLMVQTAIRTLMTSEEHDPVRFLDILNQILHKNFQRMAVDKIVSLSLLDYQQGQVRLSGQHEQLIVVRKGGRVELKDTLDLGFPLGLEKNIAQFVKEVSIDLQPGDGVVLYSDGITEAEAAPGKFYGLGQLCQVVSRHWAQPAEEIKQAVVADVHQFMGRQKALDDLTLLIIKQQ